MIDRGSSDAVSICDKQHAVGVGHAAGSAKQPLGSSGILRGKCRLAKNDTSGLTLKKILGRKQLRQTCKRNKDRGAVLHSFRFRECAERGKTYLSIAIG
ncbi:hypothetical protein F183_A26650 [Bryobacterales bacterium F-183]|nr:hypothetical protein F183_A26650 [Bryobacterales bacterium F-183]